MTYRLRICEGVLALALVLSAGLAHAEDNAELWARLPAPGTVDYGDALAHSESFHFALAFDPGVSLINDFTQDKSVQGQGAVLGSYAVVHEAPRLSYALRLDGAAVTLGGASRMVPG